MNNQKAIFYSCVCGISIIVLWLFLWLQYRFDSNQAIVAAEANVSNLSKAFEENILGTVRHLDGFIEALRRNYPNHVEKIPALLESYNRHSPQKLIIQLSITDARGIMVYNSAGMPDKPLDLSDREHIRVQMNSNEDNLFISKPVLGRVSKKWSIQFTKKILTQDGAFAGVAVLSVDPDYFKSFFESIDVGKEGAISLLGMDGVIRARSAVAAGGANPIGITIPPADIQIDPAKPSVGIYQAVSQVDRIPRIVSYRRLKGYPLVVRVAVAEGETLKTLHWHRNNLIFQGALASCGLLLIFWLALRLTTRQQKYTTDLEAMNSERRTNNWSLKPLSVSEPKRSLR
jgi:hypothetical protein